MEAFYKGVEKSFDELKSEVQALKKKNTALENTVAELHKVAQSYQMAFQGIRAEMEHDGTSPDS
jgi:uncharacterized coiled-coil DUF342 family protein